MVDGHVNALVHQHGGNEVLKSLLHLGAALSPESPGGGGGQVVGKLDGLGALSPAPPAPEQQQEGLVVDAPQLAL